MEDILSKESVQRVISVLSDFDKSLKVEVLNSSAKTAKEAASSLNCEVGAIVKSLLLRTEENFILCLVAGDKRCSLNKVKKLLKKKDVSMADAEQVKNQTGFSIGGVSPIAHLKKNKIFVCFCFFVILFVDFLLCYFLFVYVLSFSFYLFICLCFIVFNCFSCLFLLCLALSCFFLFVIVC